MADIEKVRSGGDQNFMKSFLGQIQGMSGNKESYRMILKAIFPNLSQNDINEFSNTGNTDVLFEKIKAASGDYNLDTASKMVGFMETNEAYQKQMLEKIGTVAEPIVKVMNEMLGKVDDIVNKMPAEIQSWETAGKIAEAAQAKGIDLPGWDRLTWYVGMKVAGWLNGEAKPKTP